MVRPTRLHYCQYLFSTPVKYTLTHFAEHSESFSHDQINRYLSEDRLTPRMLWEHVKNDVVMDPDGYLIFQDTVKAGMNKIGNGITISFRKTNSQKVQQKCTLTQIVLFQKQNL